MPAPLLPLAGGCRCGATRIEVAAPPIVTMACHCRGCQRMSASAYSLSAAFPADAFRVTEGETALGGLRAAHEHHHCPDCLSWLFTRPDGLDFLVNVRATAFDDTSWFAPFVETFTDEALPWALTPAPHSYPRFPPDDDWARLSAAYAAQA
jgi:hypothetical protein